MLVNVGKGIEREIDVAKLPQTALDHAVYIGLRNVLMDSHASVTTDEYPDAAERATVAGAMVDKKLAALMSGDVRVQSTREGDPVRAEAIAMAIASLRPRVKAEGKHLKSEKHPDGITPAQLREAAIKTITPEMLEIARTRVAQNRAVEIGSLADIGL
jgi:hypothetical protein